jgi:hypothetical protein
VNSHQRRLLRRWVKRKFAPGTRVFRVMPLEFFDNGEPYGPIEWGVVIKANNLYVDVTSQSHGGIFFARFNYLFVDRCIYRRTEEAK